MHQYHLSLQKPLENFMIFEVQMNSVGTLVARAPTIVVSTAIYVCFGALIGCIVEKKLMPQVKTVTMNIQCEKRRALANLLIQCTATAILAEYLKILMANKGSPGAISFGMALFVMQPSIREYAKMVFCD